MKRTRAETVRLINRMYSQGINRNIVAAQLGLAPSTVSNYLSDPTGSKAEARKASYGRPCENCGRITTGCNGKEQAPKVCGRCLAAQAHDERYWNRERVLTRIKMFHAIHGRVPFSPEWLYSESRAALVENDNIVYPYTSVVLREFGTWLNAIREAGFEPPEYRNRRKPDEYYIGRILDASSDGVAPPYRKVASSINVLRERGYSWQGLRKRLGLLRRSNQRWDSIEHLLDALRELVVEGKMPHRKDHDDIGTALYKRGISWTEAADLIGATPNKRFRRRT